MPEHAGNSAMHLLVENVDDWNASLAAGGIVERLGGRIETAADRLGGLRDFTLTDRSGVLWRIGQVIPASADAGVGARARCGSGRRLARRPTGSARVSWGTACRCHLSAGKIAAAARASLLSPGLPARDARPLSVVVQRRQRCPGDLIGAWPNGCGMQACCPVGTSSQEGARTGPRDDWPDPGTGGRSAHASARSPPAPLEGGGAALQSTCVRGPSPATGARPSPRPCEAREIT